MRRRTGGRAKSWSSDLAGATLAFVLEVGIVVGLVVAALLIAATVIAAT